jgi:RNA polymerase sigma-70 factor (ECF subfamily)
MCGRFPYISDTELVLSALIGDMEAFDELVRRFRGAVLAVAEATLGRRDLAEDVAQEAFLVAFKMLPQLQEPDKFAAWLCAITRRRAWRAATRERRRQAEDLSALDRVILANSRELPGHPEQTALRNALQREVDAALDRLPEAYRLALRLHYLEEWTAPQIAEFLSLPLTTVKWRLHHGRKLLCNALTDHQTDPTKEIRDDTH